MGSGQACRWRWTAGPDRLTSRLVAVSSDPGTFLEVAKSLLSGSSNEAEFRTVSGRACYAVYGTMRKRLCGAKGLSASRLFGKAGRHAELVSAMHRGTRAFQDVGTQYSRLYAKRTRSDYKYATPVTLEDAKRAVDDAKWVISRLGTIRDKDFSSFPILPRS